MNCQAVPVRRCRAAEHSAIAMLLFAAEAFSVAGCSVGPRYKLPATTVPTAYKESVNWKTAGPNEQNLGGDWWEIFHDLQLDELERQISVSNQNLKAAVAQYQQARAMLRYSRADYFPTVTADPSANRERYSANSSASGSQLKGKTVNDFAVPLNISYETNAWGRVSRNVEYYREQAQASEADLAVVNLTLHTALAVDYFAARTLDAEEKLLRDTVVQYEQALQLNEDRYHGGIASEVDVEQAKTILKTTQAMAVDVGVARSQFEHAVAVLIGKPPSGFALPPLPLTADPPQVPVGVPSELLERRPDIAAAERRVASANAQIGLAKLAYYPLINLTAGGGFGSGVITTLFQGPSAIWSVGASAGQTIFDVGRRRALSDEAKAGYDFAVASYRETTLTAFQQVEDSLAALSILDREAGVQDEAVKAAQQSLALSVTRYEGGVTNYLEVIVAQNALLENQVAAVNILGRRMASAVTLIEALGGGWDKSLLVALGKETSTRRKL
ncbi:MAG: efflux transporter outer membrane subunit [Acidobacteriaceae bacterium]|nr:efflux transporter outer membrane subunit [Acidobacteriaceae bacterium]